MNIRNFINDDDAVSPVIGVILMVAITVILAAVIGTFVLGLGDQVSSTSPSASFTFDFDSSTNGNLTITHDGGDAIAPARLNVTSTENFCPAPGNDTGNCTTGSGPTTVTSYNLDDEAGGSNPWVDSDVSAGSSFTIVGEDGSATLDEATVRVVWSSSGGDDTATLGKWDGPNA